MGSREQGRRRRLDAVQRAAAELFRDQGYESTTVRQIAERAGVSTGTVMSAGDKATLLLGLITEAIDDLMPVDPAAGEGSPAELVWRCYEPYFAFYDANPELSRPYAALLLGAPERRFPALGEQATAFNGLVADRIRGSLPHVDADAAGATAEALFAVYIFALVLWASGSADLERATAVLRGQIGWQLSRFETETEGSRTTHEPPT